MSHQDCKVCLESYNCEDRCPHSLSCGHSVCASCLRDLVKHKPLLCPYCRALHRGQTNNVDDDDDVPVNYALMSLLEGRAKETVDRDDVIESLKKGTEDRICVQKTTLEDQMKSIRIQMKNLKGQAEIGGEIKNEMAELMKYLDKTENLAQQDMKCMETALADTKAVSEYLMHSLKTLNAATSLKEAGIAEEEALRAVENTEPFLRRNQILISRKVLENAEKTHSECRTFLAKVKGQIAQTEPPPLPVRPKTSFFTQKGLGWQVAGKTATHDGFSAGLSRATGNQRDIPIQHDYNTRSATCIGHAGGVSVTMATGGSCHDSGAGYRGPGYSANYIGTVATGGNRHDSGTKTLNTVEATRYMFDAASKGNTEVVENMLQMGADIHAKSFTEQDNGGDALHVAADSGHSQVVRFLLEKGASVKAQDDSGATALHLAAKAGHSEIVKLLIRNGADPDVVDKDGFPVIHTAAVGGHESVLDALGDCHFRALLRTRNGQTPLHLAADYGNLEAVKWLVRKGINFNLKDDSGYTALHYATQGGHKSVAEFLNQQVLEQQKKFLEAAEQGTLRVVQDLLKSGVDVNCTKKDEYGNDQGTTAVHLAAKGGHLQILKMLNQEGGNVRVCNIDNTSPLHFAAAFGQRDVAKWLLERGVDKSIKTISKNLTAEDVALKNRHYLVADLVKDHRGTAPTQKGLPQGMKSLGNTCYMNAVTQCLFNTSPLTEYVLSQAFSSSINTMSQSRGEIANCFGTVIQILENYGDSYSAMQNFKRKVEEQDRLFRGNWQQEAQDFLSTLLDSLDKDLMAFGRSHIADLFFGKHRSTITCLLRGELQSQTDEPFLCLTLPVVRDYMTGKLSLQSLLENYYKPREIEWDCTRCNRSHPCQQEIKVLKLPKIMIIHFSRFSGGTPGRYRQLVDFPDVCNDFSNSVANGTERKRKYSLYGVCTMHSGHYVATCRDKRDKSRWFSFNDEEVREVSGPSKEGAHILFYEDIGQVDPSLKDRAYGVANKVIQYIK